MIEYLRYLYRRTVKWIVYAHVLVRIGRRYICTHNCQSCRCFLGHTCALIVIIDKFRESEI